MREYKATYFLEEYKAQYNKTYFEDEANLRSLACRRLNIFLKTMGWKQSQWNHKSILEIGSATGFFLDEAKKIGLQTQGIELSEEGVKYAREALNLNVQLGDFLGTTKSWQDQKFDAIFAFFTLEHMPEIEPVWENLNRLLQPKGGLFLALPSFYGPVFYTQPLEWFRTHPQDHFYDYSPNSIKNVLNHYHMEVKYSKPLSYHPKRDLGWRGKLPKIGYRWLADRTCYGDTFQIIAKKK
ncbi:MAG: methyltransferase domain-containing protein [Leptospira sp.]|nr:methyltransferase domain-containing protein [Leptospira sp.]